MDVTLILPQVFKSLDHGQDLLIIEGYQTCGGKGRLHFLYSNVEKQAISAINDK
jgi:hypothetical protein